MQSTFPSPGAIAPSGGNMTGGAQKIAGGIKSEETRDASGEGVFTPFLSLLSQALDRTEQGEPGENPVAVPFDAELFAARDEADAERMATPSDGMNETLLFSKSVLDLMVSIKNGLEEKGVDVAGLSRQVGEVLGEVLPGLDMERLRAMMTRLRNQYDSAADAASVSGVREGVDAALNSSESGGVSGEGGPTAVNFPTFFPVSPEAQDTGDATNAVSESVALSRFASYLRAEARSASRETSKEGTADEGEVRLSQEEKRDGKTSSTGRASDVESMAVSGVAVAGQGAEGKTGTNDEKSSADDGKSQGEDFAARNRTRNNSESALKAEKADEGANEKQAVAAERRTGFEQFFDDVMARRGQADTRVNALDLANSASGGSALSRNGTLREGLDNVVRFIRTNGEQKAALIVDPPALGRVSVELISGTTGLEASIKVSSEQVRQLIQDQIAQLRMSLAQQGVQLTHFSVDVQQDSNRQRQGAEQQKGRSVRGVSGEEDPDDVRDEQSIFRVDLNQGLLYWVA